MQKSILITDSTDGIGLETAKMLASEGRHVLMHGRNSGKLEAAMHHVSSIEGASASKLAWRTYRRSQMQPHSPIRFGSGMITWMS